jgi:putative endonuclease
MTSGQMARQRAEKAGRWAEHAAALWLFCKGYRLVARRVRTPVGEIDLIMARGRTLAFVEVKRRADAADALAAVLPAQRRRIERAAQWYLARHPAAAARFDVVAISPWRWPRHLPNAWGLGE